MNVPTRYLSVVEVDDVSEELVIGLLAPRVGINDSQPLVTGALSTINCHRNNADSVGV